MRARKDQEESMKANCWIAVMLIASIVTAQDEKPWERGKRMGQDKAGGVPQEILAKQKIKKVERPSLEDAAATALTLADQTAKEALAQVPKPGVRTLRVPAEFATIRAAIEAAKAGDTVLVSAGTYYEQLDLKDGVRLVSDGSDEPVAVEGARLKLPRRALATILDGSKSEKSPHGMIDFAPGASRATVVDGFTIQNLPKQDHHQPYHAHGINIRGASPTIMNCLVRHNGSTGIGNHAIYHDQTAPMPQRDFRRANIKHEASALIYHNVVHNNFGLGIGCNHFSAPLIIGNEVFGNDDAELGELSPGMGCKHGAAPLILGNIVHDNSGGGILCKVGEPQGTHQIDGPTHPEIRGNVVFNNGKSRPAIATDGGGSADQPVRIIGNCVIGSPIVGIALADKAVGVVTDNRVCDTAAPGIAINHATVLKLERNEVTGSKAVGFAIVAGSTVWEMTDNAAAGNVGPRFMLKDSVIKGTKKN
jgi:hypothetical protein